MNITIISINYAPEETGIGLYSTQMAEYLVKKKWEVTVIAGFPYYPKWKISDNYKDKDTFFEEDLNGVRVLRFKQFVPSNPTLLPRIIHILDFTSGSLTNIRKITKTDVVLSVVPFTSSAWLGKKLSKRLKAKHWIHMQDFEFDAAFQFGLASQKGIGVCIKKALNKLENSLLNSADIVSTISNGMCYKLDLKTTSKTFLFPNWIDPFFINPLKAKKHAYLNSDKFKILYSGNVGFKQDWDFFTTVVEHYKNQNDIEFIIVGSGARKKLVEELSLKYLNVKLYETILYHELNDLLCSSDMHVLFQKEESNDTVMPSKILGMIASGKPSIITGNLKSDVAKVFKKVKAGKFYGSTDLVGVIKGIDTFKKERNMENTNSENARKYILQNYAQDKILESFQTELNKLVYE